SVERPGSYRLEVEGAASPAFRIGTDVYASLPASVIAFFRVQRCGNTAPAGHAPCHLDDAVGPGGAGNAAGGWHDAGDHLNFLEPASYSALVLLYAADRYPGAFPAVGAGVPAPAQEARVGVDWLLKMFSKESGGLYQVGDAREHDFWVLPERE